MSTQLAWAAGLFEGEGCFWISRCGREPNFYYYPRAGLNSTDRDILEKFARVVGVGILAKQPRPKKQAHHKEQWSWTVSRTEDVRRLFDLLKPWLGMRRCEQAEQALQHAGQVAPSTDDYIDRRKIHKNQRQLQEVH